MATIATYPFLRHLRATPTSRVRHLVDGQMRHDGVGAAFWFRPLTSAISEVPVDDQERAVLVTLRTADLQQVSVPSVVAFRVVDPGLAASRVDFSIDLATGRWARTPLETLGAAIHGAACEAVTSALAGRDLAAVLATDLGDLRSEVRARLAADPGLGGMGLEVVGVRFAVVRPEPDVERALQTPAREAIQQEADRATCERRARAVEREAAIGENELANQIELARRREQLIEQEGANSRREVEEQAARERALAEARADAERVLGLAAADSERARIESYADVPRELVLALAVREVAEHLPAIDHLVVTPDLLQGLLSRLTGDARE